MNRITGIMLLLTGALRLAAQTPDMTKPPVSPEQKPYKLPPVAEVKLPNGLTVLMAEDARFPLFTARLAFNGGAKRDQKELPGLAAATGAMLTQGTKARSYRQIAEELDTLGATLSASASPDAVAIFGSTLAENGPKLLTLMADVARNAEFPDAELTLYKQNQKQALLFARSQPAVLATEEFRRRVFGDHPYAKTRATAESLDKMDRAALATYRDTFLVPNNAYLILVGKLPARAALTKMINDEFGAWQKKDVPAYTAVPVPAAKKQLVIVDRPGSVQADVRIGRAAATYNDPDYIAETMGSVILGGGPSSRLFNDIREKRGYAYDVHTEQAGMGDAGMFSVVTQVRNEVAADALQGILDDKDAIGKDRVGKEELSGAKSLANGLFLIRLEPQAGLANQLEQMKIMNLPKDYLENYTTRINSVEPDQITGAAKKYMVSGNDAVIVVGDAAKIEKALSEKLGKFEVVKPN